ncbi:dipeptidyl peptidase III [Nemania sp. FL0031]|nr:dipeptidyl peptidase III [Nemania sp. FL0031]
MAYLDAPCHILPVKEVFERLSESEKLYAHHMSHAAWSGSRIIMRQVSPEATGIFDFIISIYKSCNGKWQELVDKHGVSAQELAAFLEYASHFLYNMGNYWGEGDRKFGPDLSADALRKFGKATAMTQADLEASTYYPGEVKITKEEIEAVSKVLERHKIEPENTRLRKILANDKPIFEVLQASSDTQFSKQLGNVSGYGTARTQGADHAKELTKVCDSLLQAKHHTGKNNTQKEVIDHYIRSFKSGNMEFFRDAQKAWVKDKAPAVECILGFVETYRDPHGVRGEWEALVGISDLAESLKMRQFVARSDTFLRLMPWAKLGINNDKGPFEKDTFEAPDYTSLYSLAFCTSYSFEATNVPNYNDIREKCGFKNIVVANRMNANNDSSRPCHYVDESEVKRFKECTHVIRFITTAIHELLGHGSGKLLCEESPGQYNFNKEDPPINPLNDRAIETWYLPGQTWTSIFGTLATSIEECRAMLVSLYLIDNKELLSIFGHDDTTAITADDLHYYTYLQIGVEGLQGLAYYNSEQKTWGEAHKRAHWAILKHLLLNGEGVIKVGWDKSRELIVKVDRSKMLSDGKRSLGEFLRNLHIWRCTANVKPCSDYYEEVTSVTGEHEEWRQHVARHPEPRWRFIHANTFLKDGEVTIKEYNNTNEGMIQSWAERDI